MKRKHCITVLIFGILLIAAAVIITFVSAADKSIIGGADLPTFLFVFFEENGGICFLLSLLGLLSSTAALIFALSKGDKL